MAVPHTDNALPDKMEQLAPLQVLLAFMQHRWAAGDEKDVAALPYQAAIYVHTHTALKCNFQDLSQLTDAELDRLGNGRGMEAEAEDQE